MSDVDAHGVGGCRSATPRSSSSPSHAFDDARRALGGVSPRGAAGRAAAHRGINVARRARSRARLARQPRRALPDRPPGRAHRGGGGEVAGRVAAPQPLTSATALRADLTLAREARADYAVCFSDGPVGERLARQEVADLAGSVVVVDGEGAPPFPHLRASFHRVHHVVVAPPGGDGAEPVRRDAIVLHAWPSDLRRTRLGRLADDARRGLRRVARAVGRRRVGLALGGGAAWGYAHVALIRALERERIPVDMVAGVSMGSMGRRVLRQPGSRRPRPARRREARAVGGRDRLGRQHAVASACSCAATSPSRAWRTCRCRWRPSPSTRAPRASGSSATARSPPPCVRAARCPASRRRSSAGTATSTAPCATTCTAEHLHRRRRGLVIAGHVVPLPGVPRGRRGAG